MRAPATRRRAPLALRLLLISLIAGCTPAASATPSATLPPATASSLTPSATVVPTLPPTPSPTTPSTPEPSLAPVGTLLTPVAPKGSTSIRELRWTKIQPDNELATLASMSRWSGGLVAAGELVVSGGSARTPVWTSADGATWTAVGPDVFGHAAAVLGIAPTPKGLVALTAQASAAPCEDDPQSSCIVLRGPVASLTSTDGVDWTAHEAAGFDAFGPIEQIELRSSSTGVLAFVREHNDRGVAISADGVAWEFVPATSLPAGFEVWNVDSFDGQWLATGITWGGTEAEPFGQPMVVTSSDGRSWQVRSVPTAGFPELFNVDVIGSDVQQIHAARDGVIVTGQVQGAPSPETWWSSLDGQAWRPEPAYRPVGVWIADGIGSGITADGVLVANGSVMIAFRVQDHPAAWSSTDGRHWTTIAMHGNPYEGPDSGGGRILDTPVGIVWQQSNGVTWLGTIRVG